MDDDTDPRGRPVVYSVSPDESGSRVRPARFPSVPAAIALWVAVAVVLMGGAYLVVNAINPVGPAGRTPELWLPTPTPAHTNADATRSVTPSPTPSGTPTHRRKHRHSASPGHSRHGDDRTPGRHDDDGWGSHDDHGGSGDDDDHSGHGHGGGSDDG